MSDQVSRISRLLSALSRLPGLGFLEATDVALKQSAGQARSARERSEELANYAGDAKKAAKDVGRK